MAQHTQIVIPFASTLDEGCHTAIKTLVLPNLSNFLKQAEHVGSDNGDEFDFIPPHERAAVRTGVVLTPCNWLVGIDRISMANPAQLQLTDLESQTLFSLMRPYFLEVSIELMYSAPLRWYASGNCLKGMTFASLDRVIGRNVDAWQPAAVQSQAIRRLQNEMQMLLYTHSINEARSERGLPTINSFWLSHEIELADNTNQSLVNAALASDWPSWAAAWLALDKTIAGCTALTLCGERNAHTYAIPTSRSIVGKVKQLFKPSPSLQSVLAAL